MDIFLPNVNPTYSTTVSTELRVQTIKFGNGYEQRAKDGFNNAVKKCSLQWKAILGEDYDYIYNFFTAQAGVKAFLYQIPELDTEQRKYKTSSAIVSGCTSHRVFSLKVEIQEVFDLT